MQGFLYSRIFIDLTDNRKEKKRYPQGLFITIFLPNPSMKFEKYVYFTD